MNWLREVFGQGPNAKPVLDPPSPRQRTILSLNGGGLRGVISLGLLRSLEDALGGGPLAESVDLVGGTSTGAVIATGLALDLSLDELVQSYTEIAPAAFQRSYWRLPGLHALFDPAPMDAHFEAICGDRTLASPDLKTHLALMLKRVDTDEIWTVTNNPEAPFWANPGDGSFVANSEYKLADLLKAATAAPHYFEPEPIPVGGEADGVFIDAGVTPYNNPALALFHLVLSKHHGFEWQMGEDKLRIISVGTGGYRNALEPDKVLSMSSSSLALTSLLSSVRHGGKMISRQLKFLGRDMVSGEAMLPDPLFEVLRLDVTLESAWLREHLDMDVGEAEVAQLRRLDNTQMLDIAHEIGVRAGKRLITAQVADRLLGTEADAAGV